VKRSTSIPSVPEDAKLCIVAMSVVSVLKITPTWWLS
jgi:hypothetical protein